MLHPFDISSEIEALASKINDKKAQAEFVMGFEEAIRQSQSSSHDMPVHDHLKKGLSNAGNFGKSLGFFIGTLRFHPRKVINSGEDANHFIESLRCLKDSGEFYSFAREKFSKWQKRVKIHFKELEESEKRAFMAVIRWI